MNTRLLVRTVSALLFVFIGLLITGCASSSSEEVQREYQTTLEGFLREYAKDEYDGSVKGNDLLAIWCSKSKEETLSFLEDLLYVQAAREKFLNQLNPNTEFMRWTSACNIVINERPGAYEALIAEKEEKKVASEKARVASVKFQKELDVLDKKAIKLGLGSYTEMLYASNKLESLIEEGAQYSLTGQGRVVENASCYPTTYSLWSGGEPSSTWYCYLNFLDGGEPYTIKVNGSRWGGSADRGSSAGDLIEFNVSRALEDWLAIR